MQGGRREEAGQPASRSASRQTNGMAAAANGKGGGGLQPLQQRLQQHIDREDRRIKDLTEAILYDFLPRALKAAAGSDDLARELTPDKCRAVAGATLAVAALMNAPPGFLEFLLCVPWATLGTLYPCAFDPTGGVGANTGSRADGATTPALYFNWAGTALGGGAGPVEGGGGQPGSPSARSGGAGSAPQLEVSKEERAAIVNLPMDPSLMDCVLDFLLREKHAESLPPMMRVTVGEGAAGEALQDPDQKPVTRETVAALLDGATSLHCAAIRGNPAQVDHLLLCGADPLVTNAAGEMPVENVPVCGDRCIAGKLSCRCMAPSDQEAWECRSRLARTLILRRCIVSWGRRSFGAWLRVVALCLLSLLGLWGHHASLRRPALDAHVAVRRERRRQAALQKAQSTLLKMRTNVSSGRELLRPGAKAARGGEGPALDPEEMQAGPPPESDKENDAAADERNGRREGSKGSGGAGGEAAAAAAAAAGNLLVKGGSYMLGDVGAGAGGCRGVPGAFERADKGYACFSVAVDLLQTLELGGGSLPRSVVEVGGTESESFLVREEEQAAIYAGWAEAALFKFRACGCAGCATLALHTSMAAHRQLASLFAALERRRHVGAKSSRSKGLRPRSRTKHHGAVAAAVPLLEGPGEGGGQAPGLGAVPQVKPSKERERERGGEREGGDGWHRVGCHLATAVHVSMCVLLGTDVRTSATRAGVWRAQQCLQEWGRLRGLGLTDGLGGDECLEAECLECWAKSAAADLVLAEALRGAPVAPRTPLAEVLPLAVQYDMQTGAPSLNRPVSREVVQQLVDALELARPYASPDVLRVADAVARQMQDEIAAGERLRELLQPRSSGGGGSSGAALVEQLSEAIAAGERFPNLQAELEQARGLRERCVRRAEAQAQLDAVIDEVATGAPAGLISRPQGGGAPVVDAAAFWLELNSRLSRLEAAAEIARQANIGVSRAKRVLKELSGQGAAVEAAAKLDEALAEGKAGSGAIKAALAKAEAALTGASGGAGSACAFQLGVELLTPRIQAARQKLEVERAAEGLCRAVACCKGVADLPRLEAAILAARKLGAQGMHPEAYRAASDLRTRLEAASRARSSLEAALRSLQKLGRLEDADAVERAAEEAEACGDLVAAECQRARETVHRWHSAAASEAKLTRALKEGVGTQQLSRVIKEAAASGVKVGEARRLLKLMQGLEAAVQAAVEGPFQYQALKAKIEAAEVGGAPPGLLASVRATMQRLLLREVRSELDAVLKAARNKADKSVTQRLSGLKTVLEKADTVLCMERELAEQEQHVQQRQQGAGGARAEGARGGGAGSASEAATSPRLGQAERAGSGCGSGSATALSVSDAASFSQPGAEGEVGDGLESGMAASQAASGAKEEEEEEEEDVAAGAVQGAAAAPEAELSGATAEGEGLPEAPAAAAASTAAEAERQEERVEEAVKVGADGAANGTHAAPTEGESGAADAGQVAGQAEAGSGGAPSQGDAVGETVGGAEGSGAPALPVVVPPASSQAASAVNAPSAAANSSPAGSPKGEASEGLPLPAEGAASVAAEQGAEGEGAVVAAAAAGGEGQEEGEAPSKAAKEASWGGAPEEGSEAAEPPAPEDAGGTDAAPAATMPTALASVATAGPGPPAAAPEAPASGSDDDTEAETGDDDDLAVVLRLVKRVRRQLSKEEAEQARIERERAEEARARREAQAQLKAERERADKERAERAKVERAERRAAQEAAKAERRERERLARLEKEREREGRERAAREHFAALQRQRRQAQASGAAAAQQQQAAAAAAALLAPPQTKASPRALPLAAAAGGGAASASPRHGLPHPPPQLPPHAAAMLDAAEMAQHARHDSLEMLSVNTGLLELLGEGDTGRFGGAGLAASQHLHSSEASLLSPSSTTTSQEAWDSILAPSGPAADSSSVLLGAAGARWPSGDNAASALGTSCTGSEQSLGATLLSPEWSPARLAQHGAGAGSSRIRFSDLGGASWLAEGGAGPGGEAPGGGLPATSVGLVGAGTVCAVAALAAAAGPAAGVAGSGVGLGLGAGALWGGGGSLDAHSAVSSTVPLSPTLSQIPGLHSRDDFAGNHGLGHSSEVANVSSIWQGHQAPSGLDGWGGSSAGGGSMHHLGGGGGGGGGVLSPGRAGGAQQGLSQQQQRRQQQLLAAIDAAKAQLSQQVAVAQAQAAAAAAAQQAQQAGQGQQRVCKYFQQGFCREGHKCRYAHTAGGSPGTQQALAGLGPLSLQAGVGPSDNTAAALSAFTASRLGVAALLGSSGGGGLGGHLQGGGGSMQGHLAGLPMAGLPPGDGAPGGSAGGAVSSFAFGAPGSLAFNSAPVSRSPTPDVRASQQPVSSPLSVGLALPAQMGAGGGSAAFAAGLGALFSPRSFAAEGGAAAGLGLGTYSGGGGHDTLLGRPAALSDSGSSNGTGGGLAPSTRPSLALEPPESTEGLLGLGAVEAAQQAQGSPGGDRDHFGLPSEASLFSDLLPSATTAPEAAHSGLGLNHHVFAALEEELR